MPHDAVNVPSKNPQAVTFRHFFHDARKLFRHRDAEKLKENYALKPVLGELLALRDPGRIELGGKA